MSPKKRTWLTALKEKWFAFGQFMGNLVARVVLTVFYFLVFAPFAIGARLFSDMLGLKTEPGEFWHDREPVKSDMKTARQQG